MVHGAGPVRNRPCQYCFQHKKSSTVISLILLLTFSGNVWWAFTLLLLLTKSYASCSLQEISLFAVEWEAERCLNTKWGVTELCLEARMCRMLLKHLQHSPELAHSSTAWDQVSGEHALYDISWFFLRHIVHFGLLLPNWPTTLNGSAGCYGFFVCLFLDVICI